MSYFAFFPPAQLVPCISAVLKLDPLRIFQKVDGGQYFAAPGTMKVKAIPHFTRVRRPNGHFPSVSQEGLRSTSHSKSHLPLFLQQPNSVRIFFAKVQRRKGEETKSYFCY